MGAHARVGIEHLDQQHLLWTLLAEVVPFVSFAVVRVKVGALEPSPDVVAFDEVLVENRRGVAACQRVILNGILDRPPDTSFCFGQLSRNTDGLEVDNGGRT